MKIGHVIRNYRKEKGFTQEEMANRLGVSTPAVNKWENDVSLPDVTMLMPLARLLGISVDTLLSFRENLTEEEVRVFINRLWEQLNQGEHESAFLELRRAVETYPNCFSLMVLAAQAFEAYYLRGNLPSLYCDMSHPSVYGAYLSACVHYASITGKRVSDTMHKMEGIDDEMLKVIKEIADEVVFG